MIALYSFKKFDHYKPLGKLFLDIAYVSVELAKKHMKTKLVCDQASKEYFDSAGIFFDEYKFLDSIENYKGDRYCMPKIFAMVEETEPYVHLDFDTFIFSKPASSYPVAFAYPEVPIGSLDTFKLLSYTYRTYVESYETKFYPLLDKQTDHKLKWDIFPSNAVLLVNNPEIVTILYNEIINKFIPKEILEDLNPSFIEQFCIANFLRIYNVEYEFIHPGPNFDIIAYGESTDDVKDKLHRAKDFIHLGRYDWYPQAVEYLLEYIKNTYNIYRKNKLV